MNKFIKHKVQRIDAELSLTVIPHILRSVGGDVRTNREANRVLRAVRSLPKEFLLKNNPAIEELVRSIAQHKSQDVALKMGINQSIGVEAVAAIEAGTATIPEFVQEQIEKRKLAKRAIIEQKDKLQSEGRELCWVLKSMYPKTVEILRSLGY